MDNSSYDYSKQEGYYGSKEDYYDENGNCYNFDCNDFLKNKDLVSKEIKFKISKEKKEKLEENLKKYFDDKRDKKLEGQDLDIILNFFIDEVMPDVYNDGVIDAYIYIIEKILAILEIRR